MNTNLNALLKEMPVVAVLRYIKPEEVAEIGQAIYEAGIGVMEVPLNSPDPLTSIAKLKQTLGDRGVVGAGTVLTADQVDQIADAGAEIAVAANVNIDVIQRAIEKQLVPIPGFATATEAFNAYQAGAKYLKLFPASFYGSSYIKALNAVLPTDAALLAFGGVSAANAKEMLSAGAQVIGTGSDLYSPGDSAEQVGRKAEEIVNLVRSISNAT